MADTYTQKYVYPANWQGGTPGPEGPGEKHVDLLLMFRSTGTTGQTGVVVLDPADWRLQAQAGKCPPCLRLGIESASWDINSKIDYIRFYWDRSPNEDALICPNGTGEFCFKEMGGLWDNSDGIEDGTGRLLMDVVGAADKGAYAIQLNVLLGE